MPNPFLQSPYLKRLRRDREEMEQLREESSILGFETRGDPEAPTGYLVIFNGRGLQGEMPDAVSITEIHQVEIALGGEYPRRLPNIIWKTPILHPNVHQEGYPCLGFFAMSPAVRLVDLVEILWDMARMAIFNSAQSDILRWNNARRDIGFPVDQRTLRDRILRKEPEPPGSPPDVFIMGASQGNPEWTKRAIEQFLQSRNLSHDSRVYTQEEWRARGEKYGNEAPFTITTEGPLYGLLNRGDWEGAVEELDEFNQFLDSLGLWYELGYAWSVHLYSTTEAV